MQGEGTAQASAESTHFADLKVSADKNAKIVPSELACALLEKTVCEMHGNQCFTVPVYDCRNQITLAALSRNSTNGK